MKLPCVLPQSGFERRASASDPVPPQTIPPQRSISLGDITPAPAFSSNARPWIRNPSNVNSAEQHASALPLTDTFPNPDYCSHNTICSSPSTSYPNYALSEDTVWSPCLSPMSDQTLWTSPTFAPAPIWSSPPSNIYGDALTAYWTDKALDDSVGTDTMVLGSGIDVYDTDSVWQRATRPASLGHHANVQRYPRHCDDMADNWP